MSALPRFSRVADDLAYRNERTLKEPLDFQNELFENQEKLPFYYKVKIVHETFWTCVLLVILSFPMLLIAAAVLIKMGRPVLFKQKRIGLNGRPFYAYKFRTMRKNAPRVVDMGYKPLEKVIDDPRVDGRIGKFLRKYKWDELPQFFNVLLGDMLLIGPRPYPYEENYEVKRSQAKRYAIRPGISGPWQVSGELNISPDEKLERDKIYIEQMSFRQDFMLFLGTLKVVFLKGEKK